MDKGLLSVFVFWLAALFLIVLIFGISSCRESNNSQLVYLPNRVLSQTETHQGIVESTATFQYGDDRIESRNHTSIYSQLKFDFEYSSDQVISYFSRKYETEWYIIRSIVYNYEAGLLTEVLYRDSHEGDWLVEERWSFTYNGNNYDEILMEDVVNGNYDPTTKLEYQYNGDTLEMYTIYNFNSDWQINREITFDYLDGRLDYITLYYTRLGSDFGPQERFNYYYNADNYNTRIGAAVIVDTGWVEQSEILKSYDVSGNMITETVQAIGDSENAYQYDYTYELGRENLDVFPFYDQPLYDHIYPTPSPNEELAKIGLVNSWKQMTSEF